MLSKSISQNLNYYVYCIRRPFFKSFTSNAFMIPALHTQKKTVPSFLSSRNIFIFCFLLVSLPSIFLHTYPLSNLGLSLFQTGFFISLSNYSFSNATVAQNRKKIWIQFMDIWISRQQIDCKAKKIQNWAWLSAHVVSNLIGRFPKPPIQTKRNKKSQLPFLHSIKFVDRLVLSLRSR